MTALQRGRSRGGFGLGEVALLLSILGLLAALSWPRVSRALFERSVDRVAADVEAVRAAAGRHLDERGSWPGGDEAGRVPAALAPFLLDVAHFRSPERSLQWHRWELIEEAVDSASPAPAGGDSVPPPPAVYRLAGISVHAGRPALLAALLERYGRDRAFVRDTVWTLVLPWREERRLGDVSPPASP